MQSVTRDMVDCVLLRALNRPFSYEDILQLMRGAGLVPLPEEHPNLFVGEGIRVFVDWARTVDDTEFRWTIRDYTVERAQAES